MHSEKLNLFVLDLSPLSDAFFETEDENEDTLIQALIEQFEARDPWPIEFFKSGYAAEHLKPYALNALRKIVEYYDDEMESRLMQIEKNRGQPDPLVMPPRVEIKKKKPSQVQEAVDVEVMEVEVEEKEISVVDLVSDTVSCSGGVGADSDGEEETQQEVVVVQTPKKRGKNIWVPSTIVCGLKAADEVPFRSRKGKEKVVEGSGSKERERRHVGVERLNLGGSGKSCGGSGRVVGGSGKRLWGLGRAGGGSGKNNGSGKGKLLVDVKIPEDYSDEKCHQMFIEDEDGGWQKFMVVEDYDSGLSDCPDIPMSPLYLRSWTLASMFFFL